MAKPIHFKPLKAGQTIGVMAPSSYVEKEDIAASQKRIEDAGFKTFIHPQTYERHHQSAGTTLQKALALQGLWMRKDIDAIWFAGGGNQALELLSALNIDALKRMPAKPLIGFSDTTCLLNILSFDLNSTNIHGPVFKQLHTLEQSDFDQLIAHLTSQHDARPASAITAPLIGGNLSLYQYCVTLRPDIVKQDHILMLEDCNEELSHIDRTLQHLSMLGAFKQTKAVLLGHFNNLTDSGRPYGLTFDDIIAKHFTEQLNIPVSSVKNFGHAAPNHPYTIGAPFSVN